MLQFGLERCCGGAHTTRDLDRFESLRIVGTLQYLAQDFGAAWSCLAEPVQTSHRRSGNRSVLVRQSLLEQ